MVDLLDRLDSRELVEWGLFFALRHDEAELRADGLTEDEIVEAIARGGAAREPEGDEPGLLDTLLGPEAAAERRLKLLQDEDALLEDDDDDG